MDSDTESFDTFTGSVMDDWYHQPGPRQRDESHHQQTQDKDKD